jgi:hypothetical protein
MKYYKLKSNYIKQKTVKPDSNRIEFERLLKKFGYNDRSPIHPKKEKYRKQINYMCENNSAMSVFCFISPYFTKKSYLYSIYLDWVRTHESYIPERLKVLAEYIHYHEKSRLGEVGWEVIYTKVPSEFKREERKKIVFDLFKKLSTYLKEGDNKFKPLKNDVLICSPHGPKIEQGFTEESILNGTNQRGKIAEKFGFGQTKLDGYQYAKYDENNNLIPI